MMRRIRRLLARSSRFVILAIMFVLVFFMIEYHNARGASKLHIPGRALHTNNIEATKNEWSTTRNDSLSEDSCRNTVQGRVHIADENGFICRRADLGFNGCCITASNYTRRYVCELCNSQECCPQYEICVSCCLQPSKKSFLLKFLQRARDIVYHSVSDQFETCLAKCRTSSLSVVHENTYKDAVYKFCYGQDPILSPPSKLESEASRRVQDGSGDDQFQSSPSHPKEVAAPAAPAPLLPAAGAMFDDELVEAAAPDPGVQSDGTSASRDAESADKKERR